MSLTYEKAAFAFQETGRRAGAPRVQEQLAVPGPWLCGGGAAILSLWPNCVTARRDSYLTLPDAQRNAVYGAESR